MKLGGITELMGVGVPTEYSKFWRRRHQIHLSPVQPGQAVESGVDYVQELVQKSGWFILNLLAALLTLLIGLLIAAVARAVVRESSIAL